MSITISFMHYMKWIRGMLRVVFEKFEVNCIFCYFFVSLASSIGKRSTLTKIRSLNFYGPVLHRI